MNALVTGGAGFIGSNVVRLLCEEGHRTRVIDNLMSGYKRNLDPFPEVDFIKDDIRDSKAVLSVTKRIDVIFHLAASVGNLRSIEHPIEDSEINVLGTINILEAARINRVKKVIFSSSAGIFGELKTLPIREDHPTEPDSPYGASKLAAEKLSLAYSRMYRMECVCLRYFNVYGINQRYDAYGNVIPIFAHSMLQGKPVTVFGDGAQTRDFVNVRDVAKANLSAATAKGVNGVFNIAGGKRITINKLTRLMSDAAGIKATVKHGPPRRGDVRHSLADISAAKKAFGYRVSVSIENGLRDYIDWIKREEDRED